MTLRLLCLGDLHLGRRPARLPRLLEDLDLHPRDLSPAAGWRKSVDIAIERRVHGVVLLGDVVEADNRYFEAYRHLSTGLQRLSEAGIPAYAVAGNHDVEVLPRLAAELQGFHLIGAGGTWERVSIAGDDASVRLLGWSYPEPRVDGDPLETLPPAIADGVPEIGLIHGDLDVRDTRYVSVARRALERSHLQAWLLGHIHKADDLTGPRPIGYLGTVVGLDPSERGPHGPWLLEVEPTGELRMQPLPIAPLRFEWVDIDGSEISDAETLRSGINAALGRRHEELRSELHSTRLVVVTIEISGRARRRPELQSALAAVRLEPVQYFQPGIVFAVDRILDRSRPTFDLGSISQGHDPPALLARKLLLLQGAATPERSALIHGFRSNLEERQTSGPWQVLPPVDTCDEAIAERVMRVGYQALEDLLAQRTAAGQEREPSGDRTGDAGGGDGARHERQGELAQGDLF